MHASALSGDCVRFAICRVFRRETKVFEIKRLTRSSSSTPRILIVTPDLYRGGVAQVVRRSVAEFSRLPVELILLIYEDRPVIGPIPENEIGRASCREKVWIVGAQR